MHFQAGSRVLFPIEKDAAHLRGITVPGYARNVFVFRDSDRDKAIQSLDDEIERIRLELTREVEKNNKDRD